MLGYLVVFLGSFCIEEKRNRERIGYSKNSPVRLNNDDQRVRAKP
jgi:hypothetical protein